MSHVYGILLIVFGFVAFTVLVGTIAEIAKMKIKSKTPAQLSSEESREFQQLHRGFESLAKRIEALEEILMDRPRRG